jgi:hypothetical protein
MATHRTRSTLLSAIVTIFAVAGVSDVAGQGRSRDDSWNTFVADITIRRYEVSNDGKRTGPSIPTVSYRLERKEAPSGWQTIMTLTSGERPHVRSLRGSVDLDPYSAVRIEDPGDGSPVRIIGKDGRVVPMLPPQLLAGAQEQLRDRNPELPDALFGARTRAIPVIGREWADAFIAAPERLAHRRHGLIATHGHPVGRERGLDQYVVMRGEDRVDMRTDADTAVPVSISVSRDGVLRAHTAISYVRGAGNALVRQAVLSQRRVSDDVRAVTRTEYSNVRLERRAR